MLEIYVVTIMLTVMGTTEKHEMTAPSQTSCEEMIGILNTRPADPPYVESESWCEVRYEI